VKIPIMKPKLSTFEQVEPFLRRIDATSIYSNHGPLVCELEETYAKYLSVDQEKVVALANATLAIQGLISISTNQNWLVPDYTFSATGLAVLNANRNLIICDVNFDDWKINTSLIGDEQKSYGIIPVMPFGSPIDFGPYADFDEVIIDAAASLGRKPPTFSQMKKNWSVVYSLHATKVLGAGEGAIIVCGNKSQAQLLRAWSNFGFLTQRESELCGTNAKMSEMNAAYGLYSLQELSAEREDWLKSQDSVASQTGEYTWATFVNATPQFHPYWIASIENQVLKKTIIEALNRAEIQCREWWAKPLSRQNAFAKSQVLGGAKNSKSLSEAHLGLPMFRGITHRQVSMVCEIIQSKHET
jgi:dTDP-4-amino-4,6-dideoxygalactose transaminase